MKKILIMILMISVTLTTVAAESYKFTKEQLEEYVEGIIRKVYDEKDMEIAGLIQQYDLQLLDKDKEISMAEAERDFEQGLKLEYKETLDKQEPFIRWSPVIIIGGVLGGVIGGLFLAGSM